MSATVYEWFTAIHEVDHILGVRLLIVERTLIDADIPPLLRQ